ncbi:hypothetical protein SAMN05216284_122113 [Micromonospora sediminimaris]|uniref:Flagellar basal body protein FliL n=1 Tax=Micromonospora sediminimaris TaxID=547162 RepID=A0A9W5USQ6_9ACTN|nr:hypothetical protein [Micromonospora sediminimaris]GIJ35099.1 hypothetical protein Vse01_42470 [Micromonospora sediminimaris]SFD71261.1 hypothetical protein SAMN05216284_122113 [Micromonospora sediminimaris]
MANYGPPGPGPQPWHEPQPGEQPWPEPQPGQGYGQDQGYGQGYGGGQGYRSGESYDAAGHGGGRYGTTGSGHLPPDTWAQSAYQHDAETGYAGAPTPPPQRRRGRMLVVLAVVLVLVLGGATAFYLVGRDDQTPTPVAAPTEEVASTPDPQGEEAPPDDPATAPSADPRFVQAGQCVRNDAAAGGKPRLLLSECAPRSYEVLRRFDGKTGGERDAEEKCAGVDGYTNWYFYDSELDSLDFVLCLKQRD